MSSSSSVEEFQKLLIRSQDRSVQRQKLNESVRQAYVAIAEAKMLLFAQQQHGYLEFCDSVKFGKNLLDSDDDESDDDDDNDQEENNNKSTSSSSSKNVSRTATFKLEIVGDETKPSSLSIVRDQEEKEEGKNQNHYLNSEDEQRAKTVLNEKSLKSIQDAFREILHRAVELSQI